MRKWPAKRVLSFRIKDKSSTWTVTTSSDTVAVVTLKNRHIWKDRSTIIIEDDWESLGAHIFSVIKNPWRLIFYYRSNWRKREIVRFMDIRLRERDLKTECWLILQAARGSIVARWAKHLLSKYPVGKEVLKCFQIARKIT